jgi:hypothetical protein
MVSIGVTGATSVALAKRRVSTVCPDLTYSRALRLEENRQFLEQIGGRRGLRREHVSTSLGDPASYSPVR